MSASVDEIKRYMSERNQELNEENSKLRRDNAALLVAAKAVVKEARSRYVVYPVLELAIAQAESEASR